VPIGTPSLLLPRWSGSSAVSGGRMTVVSDDALLGRIRATIDDAMVSVVSGQRTGARTFEFELGGDLNDEQEATIAAMCQRERVQLDLSSPNHRRVIDFRGTSD